MHKKGPYKIGAFRIHGARFGIEPSIQALKSSGTIPGVAFAMNHQKGFIGVSMDKTVSGVDLHEIIV